MPLLQIGIADAVPIKLRQRSFTDAEVVSTVGEEPVQVGINLLTIRRLVGDFSRGYLFQIDMPPIDDSSQTLSILAKSTILPAYTVEDKGFEFQGSKYKMAGHSNFDDWTVTFVSDEYHKLRHKFLAWQSYVYDPVRQIPFTPGSYKKNGVRVMQLSREGKIVSAYEFYGIYPNRVGEVSLSHENRDVEEFSVTFSYDYYSINTDILNNGGISHYKTGSEIDKGEYVVVDENEVNPPLYDENKQSEHSSNLLKDRSINPETGEANADVDWNGRGNYTSTPAGFLQDQIKKLNPFGRNGDINTTDAYTWMDAANWMNFRYSPPLRFRIRKYLGKDVNDSVDKFTTVPNINPYDWTGLEKSV